MSGSTCGWGNPRELECEAKGELRRSRELKAAGAGKQGSEVKPTRESGRRHTEETQVRVREGGGHSAIRVSDP